MKKNIFIDTDMGNDDIMAIAYLLMQESIKICGISVVNGVATKNNGYKNLCSILAYLKKDIPVAMGSKQALQEKNARFPLRDTKRANDLTLIRKLSIKKNDYVSTNSFEDFIFQKIKTNKPTILALGPLTNIAKVIKKYGERFTKNINELWIMGGGIARGNVNPNYKVEYNIWLDPEAAEIVFSSDIPITLIGINATDHVPINKSFTNNVRKTETTARESALIKEIIINNDNDFAAFYDPLAAFALCKPRFITKKIKTGIKVLLAGKNRGQTIIFVPRTTVQVILSVNRNMFYKEMLSVIQKSSI